MAEGLSSLETAVVILSFIICTEAFILALIVVDAQMELSVKVFHTIVQNQSIYDWVM